MGDVECDKPAMQRKGYRTMTKADKVALRVEQGRCTRGGRGREGCGEVAAKRSCKVRYPEVGTYVIAGSQEVPHKSEGRRYIP